MASVNVLAQTTSNILSSINGIVKTLIMIIIVYNFTGQNTNPYILILYTILLPLFFSNLSFITVANLNKNNMNASKRFFKELNDNIENDNIENDGSTEIEQIKKITYNINELSLGDTIINCGIHEEFNIGDVVWIKGNSGAGKSSLMKLLVKFQNSDDVLINGAPVSYIKKSSLRREVDYLSQQIPIIKGTLRENLFFGVKWSEELEEKLINIPILKQLLKTKSMDTLIEENGTNLSGGEKQKIAALRAFNSNATVLILDEITSSIDNENAIEIYNTLLGNSPNRITFVIAHDNLPSSFATRTIMISG